MSHEFNFHWMSFFLFQERNGSSHLKKGLRDSPFSYPFLSTRKFLSHHYGHIGQYLSLSEKGRWHEFPFILTCWEHFCIVGSPWNEKLFLEKQCTWKDDGVLRGSSSSITFQSPSLLNLGPTLRKIFLESLLNLDTSLNFIFSAPLPAFY